jgi:hypothetical protein
MRLTSRSDLCLAVFGATFCVRLCQFYVVQALRRWDQESGPRLKLSEHEALLLIFRRLQRCAFEGDWAKAVIEFYRQIKDEFLAGHLDADRVFEELKAYFDWNWLCVAPSVYRTHTVRCMAR